MKIIFIILLCFSLYGCSGLAKMCGGTTIQTRQDYVNYHSDISKEIKECIIKQQVAIGMTREQVKASWGNPSQINTDVSYFGSDEQWVYFHNYVYFFNDKVTNIQTRSY